MPTLTKAGQNRLINWIPLFLLVMPTVMALIPMVVQIHPKAPIYLTPGLPKLFEILLIIHGVALGGWSRLRQVSLSRPALGAALLLLVIMIYTTVWVAPNPLFSVIHLFDLMLVAGVGYFGAVVFERGGAAFMRLTLAALVGAIVLAIPLSAWQVHFRIPEYYWWPAFLPGFDFIRIYGFALTAAIAVGTGLLVLPAFQRPLLKWATLASLCLLWTVLLWTSSRGGILALIAVAPVMAYLVPAFRKALIPGLVTLAIGAGFASQIQGESRDIGFKTTVHEFTNPEPETGLSAGRTRDWKVVLDTISERPLFGYGYAQSLMVVKNEVPHAHTHNIVLEAFLAWGVIGGVCAGFLVLLLWFKALGRVMRGRVPEHIPAFYTVSVLLLYAWVDGTYFYYQALIPLAICTAILAARPKQASDAA